MDEYKLLTHILEFCERHGKRYDPVQLTVDYELAKELHDRYGFQLSIDELKAIADRCYAREWLEHTSPRGGRHNNLRLTARGMGVAVSKRRSDEAKMKSTYLKKASDYVEEHKGIFLLPGVVAAILGVVGTLLSGGFSLG